MLDIGDRIEYILKKYKNYLPWYGLVACLYITGIIFWNIYLSNFGFFEYNLIQIRYLSAGLLFWVPLVILFAIFYFLLILLKKIYIFISILLSIIFLICTIYWPFLLFKNFSEIPQYLGGAQPIPVMIIGTPEQIEYLSNFDIGTMQNANKPRVQTSDVCLIYQNDVSAIFFVTSDITSSSTSNSSFTLKFKNRVLTISRDKFIGFQALPNQKTTSCSLAESLYKKEFSLLLQSKQ